MDISLSKLIIYHAIYSDPCTYLALNLTFHTENISLLYWHTVTIAVLRKARRADGPEVKL